MQDDAGGVDDGAQRRTQFALQTPEGAGGDGFGRGDAIDRFALGQPAAQSANSSRTAFTTRSRGCGWARRTGVSITSLTEGSLRKGLSLMPSL